MRLSYLLLLPIAAFAQAPAQSDAPPELMRAVVYDSADAVKALLKRGADANVKDHRGATPLMWAIPDLAKVKVLLAAGADVNARSTNGGYTPLLIAASYPSTVEILKLLLDKGADLQARNNIGLSALTLAAGSADITVVRFLVEHGLDPNAPPPAAFPTARTLTGRVLPRQYPPTLEYLLSKGVKVLPQDLVLISHQNTGLLAAYAKAAGDVNAKVPRFLRTALINAAASETAPVANLQLLLDKGANPNLADRDGETPLDWAMHSGDQARIDLLTKAGAKPAQTPRDVTFSNPEGAPDARTALQRSVTALLPPAPVVFAKRACITCHSQSMPAQVAALARAKGIPVDEKLARQNLRQIAGVYKPIGEEALQGFSPPGGETTVGYIIMALAAENHPPDLMTAGLSHMVAARQMPDGSWPEASNRPPMEYSTITRTAMAVRVLTAYPIPNRAKQTEEHLRKARAWLLAAKPASAEEYAMRLMALAWTGLPKADLARQSKQWIAEQRADGGWAQASRFSSDAYATGITLFALHEAGVPVTDPAYRRGVDYLLKTQHSNGAWFVRTRAFPVQDQFESGFPFGYHQWISSAATSWAALAIGYTLPDVTRSSRNAPAASLPR